MGKNQKIFSWFSRQDCCLSKTPPPFLPTPLRRQRWGGGPMVAPYPSSMLDIILSQSELIRVIRVRHINLIGERVSTPLCACAYIIYICCLLQGSDRCRILLIPDVQRRFRPQCGLLSRRCNPDGLWGFL